MDAVVVAANAVFFSIVNYKMKDPYMDEIFHVPQAQRYCESNYSWDPKITTPPGLYYLARGFHEISRLKCDLVPLRTLNFVGLLLGSWMAAVLLRRPSLFRVLASFPLIAFYANLFYTDVFAVFLVLIGVGYSIRGRHLLAGLAFLVSLLFRQTSIIWAAFGGTIALLGPQLDLSRESLKRLVQFKVSGPYLVNALVFATFVYLNGGITLGDKQNHSFSLHLAQIPYFGLFICGLSLPVVITSLKEYLAPSSMLLRVVSVAILSYAMRYLLANYSFAHPFILADNRHYTFYIWRRILNRGDVFSTALLPIISGICMDWLIWTTGLGPLALVFWGAVTLVLVPSPLLEPRYFLAAWAVWRSVFVEHKPTTLETGFNLAVNGATILLFVFSKTHFMW